MSIERQKSLVSDASNELSRVLPPVDEESDDDDERPKDVDGDPSKEAPPAGF